MRLAVFALLLAALATSGACVPSPDARGAGGRTPAATTTVEVVPGSVGHVQLIARGARQVSVLDMLVRGGLDPETVSFGADTKRTARPIQMEVARTGSTFSDVTIDRAIVLEARFVIGDWRSGPIILLLLLPPRAQREHAASLRLTVKDPPPTNFSYVGFGNDAVDRATVLAPALVNHLREVWGVEAAPPASRLMVKSTVLGAELRRTASGGFGGRPGSGSWLVIQLIEPGYGILALDLSTGQGELRPDSEAPSIDALGSALSAIIR